MKKKLISSRINISYLYSRVMTGDNMDLYWLFNMAIGNYSMSHSRMNYVHTN